MADIAASFACFIGIFMKQERSAEDAQFAESRQCALEKELHTICPPQKERCAQRIDCG